MEEQYDIIVIGAGAAGLNIAAFTNHIDLDTLLIDTAEENIGGDCLNYGCIPSKALLHAADVVQSAKEAERFGLSVDGTPDWQIVKTYIGEKQETIREHENKEFLEDLGIDIAIGEARFAGPREIGIDGDRYTAKKIVIATGSEPRTLGIPGMDKTTVMTNEDVFQMDELPERLLIIGGGPIGCELGQALNRLGSDVTIVQQEDRIMPHDDEELALILQESLTDEGVQIECNSSVRKIHDEETAVIEDEDGETHAVPVDAVLLAVGRDIVLPDDLQNAGIETDDDGTLIIDRKLRTTNKDVLVCGDAAGSYQFTHAAERQARTIIENLFKPFNSKIDYDTFGWVTYTDPELAAFGLSEQQLQNRNIDYRRVEKDMEETDRGVVTERQGKLVLFLDGKTILGGCMIAPDAGELVQELILAHTHDMGLDDLFDKTYPYPTATRINRDLAIDELERLQLSDNKEKMLRILYRTNPLK